MEFFYIPKVIFEGWKLFGNFSGLELLFILFLCLVAFWRLFGQKTVDRRFRAVHRMEADEELDTRIETAMEQIYNRISPSRVILFQYYSDSRQMAGIPMINIRVTHVFPPSISDVREQNGDACEGDEFKNEFTINHNIFASLQRGVPASFFTCLRRLLHAERSASFPDIDAIKDQEPGIHDLLQKIGVKAAYILGLYDTEQRLIGFVFLHFSAHFLGDFQDEDMAYIRARVRDINTVLTFNRYDSRGKR